MLLERINHFLRLFKYNFVTTLPMQINVLVFSFPLEKGKKQSHMGH